MKIGYACIPLLAKYKTTRTLTLKNYSPENIKPIINDNLSDLYNILVYNKSNSINLFRISSDIIPLGSHDINDFPWNEVFKSQLDSIGEFILNNNMRVSMHPGQYTILNSPKEDVVTKSINDLKFHCKFLDSLNLPASHKIILHVGGVYGDKAESIKRFINVYNSLDSNIKDRLIIENDERFFLSTIYLKYMITQMYLLFLIIYIMNVMVIFLYH